MQPQLMIPTFTLQFLESSFALAKKPEDLALLKEEPRIPVSRDFFKVLEAIVRDYVFSVRHEKDLGPIQARVNFSMEKGLTIDPVVGDARLKQIYEKNLKECEELRPSPKDTDLLDIGHIKKTEDPYRKERKTLVFIDPIVMRAFKRGWSSPQEIDLKIHFLSREALGQMTGGMRFTNLYADLVRRFKHLRRERPRICIIAPEISQRGSDSSLPQYMEAFSLFPRADFLILLNNKPTLAHLKSLLEDRKIAYYDPALLRAYAFKKRGLHDFFVDSARYRMLFEEMKRSFIHKACEANVAKEVFKDSNSAQSLQVKIKPDHLKLREFDIAASEFESGDKGTYDFVVATLALDDALSERSQGEVVNHFPLLFKFLELLKEEGALYIDYPTYRNYFEKYYPEELMKCGFQWLEARLGNALKIERLSIAEYLGCEESIDEALVDSMSLEGKKQKMLTSSLCVITRTSEKVDTEGIALAKKVDKGIRKLNTSNSASGELFNSSEG